MCVEHLKRCKTSTLIDGIVFSIFFLSGSLPLQWARFEYNLLFNCRGRDGWFPSHANEAMEINWMEVWTQTSVPAVSLLGAFKSQLGDTSYCVFCRCFTALPSDNQTSTWGLLLDTVIAICQYWRFVLTLFRVWSSLSSCQVLLKCFCTYDAFHIRIRKDVSEQVCDSCWIRQGGVNPSGIPFQVKSWHFENDLWIYIFELVIRFSKVKQPFTFQLLTRRSSLCWNSFPLYQGLAFF